MEAGDSGPGNARSPENWDKVAEYVRATLLAKKEVGFLSQRALPSLDRGKAAASCLGCACQTEVIPEKGVPVWDKQAQGF